MVTESKKVRSQSQRIETVESVSGASRKLAGSVSAKSNVSGNLSVARSMPESLAAEAAV